MIKDKNLLARMADEDLRTPSHDAIMIWLQENLESVCTGLLQQETNTHLLAHARRVEGFTSEDRELVKGDTAATHALSNPLEFSAEWESPVTNKSAIVGFIDLLAKVKAHQPCVMRDEETVQVAVKGDHGLITRYQAETRKYVHVCANIEDLATIAFEVKPTIRSLGETIRQINTYRAYMRGGTRFCIVSPDDRFRAILESQGILFVKAPAVGDGSAQGGLF